MKKSQLKSLIQEVISEEMQRGDPGYAQYFDKEMKSMSKYQDKEMVKKATPQLRSELEWFSKMMVSLHSKIEKAVSKVLDAEYHNIGVFIKVNDNGEPTIQVTAWSKSNPNDSISFSFPKH
jgi:hypothetical protein